jgi:HK97 family phage portal protein
MVTNDTALAHIDVFKCRSLIADSIAMLPFRAMKMQAWTDETGQIRSYASKTPTQPILLTDPMPGDMSSAFSLMHRIVDSLLGDGNAYIEIAATGMDGWPTALYPIHPSCVRDVKLDSRGRTVFEMHDGGTMGSVRDGGTMVHLTGYTQAGCLRGISPILAGKQGIALNMAAEEFGARWFGDGAHPSGYLFSPGDISEDDAKGYKRKWVQTYGGLSREPAVLYGGLEWRPISISPEESQFIETRRFQSGQIAALYRVPPHMVGDVDKTTSWGTGIEEMGLGFVTYTLGAWLARLEQALSFLLPRGQFVKANVGALLRGRVLDSYQAFSIGKQWGWLSTNDIREMLDLAPIPGGDTYLQPLNMIDAAAALEAQLQPASSSPPSDGTPPQ